MIPLACILIVASVLWWTIKRTGPIVVNDRQPSPIDRYAAWASRYFSRPEHMRNPPTKFTPPEGFEDWSTKQIANRMKARIAFDERAGVQPLIKPRLPK